MVTTDQVIGFGLVALVLIAIPGPSIVFTVGRALTYGRAVALTTIGLVSDSVWAPMAASCGAGSARLLPGGVPSARWAASR